MSEIILHKHLTPEIIAEIARSNLTYKEISAKYNNSALTIMSMNGYDILAKNYTIYRVNKSAVNH